VLAGVAALALAGCVRTPHVEVTKLTEGKFRLNLKTVNVVDAAQGQRQLMPEARKLCGEAPVHLGRYVFEASGDAESRRTPSEPRELVQEITCGAPAPAENRQAAAPAAPVTTP
jgi:hypothetical protein